MVTFSVPLKAGKKPCFFSFRIESRCLLFAGSRNITLRHDTCSLLINAFGRLGFSFITGCASGVDESFRKALAVSDYTDSSVVACAFKKRLEDFKDKGILPLFVVPEGLPPKVALAKRTLWMTSRCSLLILFPSEPIGRGSAFAFKSAIYNNKPVFIVSDTKPKASSLYSVYPSSLFGIVKGFWVIPPIYKDTGLCYETA